MDINLSDLRDRRLAASDAYPLSRRYNTLRAIILHSTHGPTFIGGNGPSLPAAATDGQVRSSHRIDNIRAHFIVINDGTVFYTHDVDYLSRSAGGRLGVDIEFALSNSRGDHLSQAACLAGQQLIRALSSQIPSIDHIHPHGQVQKENMDGRVCGGDTGRRCGKLTSCPGSEIWRRVGTWGQKYLNLRTDPPLRYYQNNGIHQ